LFGLFVIKKTTFYSYSVCYYKYVFFISIDLWQGVIMSAQDNVCFIHKGSSGYRTADRPAPSLSEDTIAWIKVELSSQAPNTYWAYWSRRDNQRYLVQISLSCYNKSVEFMKPKGAVANGVLAFPPDVSRLAEDTLGVFVAPLDQYECALRCKLEEILELSFSLKRLGLSPVVGRRTSEHHSLAILVADPSDLPYWLSQKLPPDVSRHDALSMHATLERLDACKKRLNLELQSRRK
jgi:hypothetical protein